MWSDRLRLVRTKLKEARIRWMIGSISAAIGLIVAVLIAGSSFTGWLDKWQSLIGAILQAAVAGAAAIYAAMAFRTLRRQVDGEEQRHHETLERRRIAFIGRLRHEALELVDAAVDLRDDGARPFEVLSSKSNSYFEKSPEAATAIANLENLKISRPGSFDDWEARSLIATPIERAIYKVERAIEICTVTTSFRLRRKPPYVAKGDHRRIVWAADLLKTNAEMLARHCGNALKERNGKGSRPDAR